MPNITIYLNDELYQFVKKSPSKIIQEALITFLGIREESKKKKE